MPSKRWPKGGLRLVSIALLYLSWSTVISFTTQSLSKTRRKQFENQSLLFSRHEISDLELTQSIIRANTTRAIEKTLRDAHPQPHSFNVSAVALRRVAHVSILERRTNIQTIETQQLRESLLKSLLKNIEGHIVKSQNSNQSLTESTDIFLASDVFIALAVLQLHQAKTNNPQPLAILIVETLLSQHKMEDLHKLGPIRLLQCLQALSRLRIDEREFRSIIFQRLLKPDAVSKLPPRSISHGMAALAASDMEDRDSKLLARSFMRRLRKQKVREQATIEDLCRALVSADVIFKKDGMDEFRDEAAVFGFTTLRVIIQKKRYQNVALSPKQLSEMICAWSSLSSSQSEDTLIEELLQICQEDAFFDVCSLQQLENVIGSVERLQATNHSEIMRRGGERLLLLLNSSSMDISPKTINGILRCPVLLHRHNQTVLTPYQEAASSLFRNQTFLAACKTPEIANFLWFISSSPTPSLTDHNLLVMFGNRLLEPDIVDSCNSKLASRILGTFTSIITLDKTIKDNEEVRALAFDLFHEIGVHLLTTRLLPAEAASAIYAYAKASYVADMGVVDHLFSELALMKSQCTVRQLSQSLYSAGKMMAFEGYEEDEDQLLDPPYLDSARKIAQELCLRVGELTTADLTQCFWALSNLGIHDESLLNTLTNRATELVNDMNAIESVNVLWSLGKLRVGRADLVLIIAKRLIRNANDLSPKQAASAMYALGRLKIESEEIPDIFDQLSMSIIDQIDSTSAHSIANVLWSYRSVKLKPPQKLLNLWASEKLGVVTVQFQQQSDISDLT